MELRAVLQSWGVEWTVDSASGEQMLTIAAGANVALKAPYFSDPKWSEQLSLSSASGIHVLAIPQWIIGQIVNRAYLLVHRLSSCHFPDGVSGCRTSGLSLHPESCASRRFLNRWSASLTYTDKQST
jgi:hypothetical protein